MTRKEKKLERIKILMTLDNHGPLLAHEVVLRANNRLDWDHEELDDLPPLPARGMGQKLNAMSLDGLLTYDWVKPELNSWKITQKGKDVLAKFEAQAASS